MTINEEALQTLCNLAYLDSDNIDSQQLSTEINAILDFVEQIKAINTNNIEPLYQPITEQQFLRPDKITESNCEAQLKALAPLFDEGLYWVPKVITNPDEQSS